MSLGRYRIIASLARGGMAHVYLGLFAGPADFNKLLVLKVLREGVLSDAEGSVQMFLNEARLAARLVHPNIVHTYEVGESGGRYFLAMEYLEGQTYRALTRKAGPYGVSPFEHLRILTELARGLHYLHEQTHFDGSPLNAVHRDVSPQNVLLGYEGQVKLLDFGIAKTAEASHWTQVDTIKGKLDYIAPEQLLRENVDRRADVFALGVMLYEALAGRRFAGGASVPDYNKVENRLQGNEPALHEVAPAAPKELIAIAQRALAIDPDNRFPTAGALADALEGFAKSTPRPSAASMGARLSKLFEQDRQTMQKLIELEIERARESRYVELKGELTGRLPRLGARESVPSASWPAPPLETPQKHERHDGELTARASLAGDSGHRPVSPRRGLAELRPRSWSVVLAIVAAAACLAWLTTPGKPDRPVLVPSSQSSTGPASAPQADVGSVDAQVRARHTTSEPPQRETVRATVTVQPPGAHVQLDGVHIEVPFTGVMPRDEKLHMLRASARGYRSYRTLIGFDRDRVIEIVLQPRRGPRAK